MNAHKECSYYFGDTTMRPPPNKKTRLILTPCPLFFLFGVAAGPTNGQFENRIRLALEVVRAARREVNPDFVLVFRLSMLDLVDGGSDWAEVVELAKALEENGVDIINTGIG